MFTKLFSQSQKTAELEKQVQDLEKSNSLLVEEKSLLEQNHTTVVEKLVSRKILSKTSIF